MAFINVKSEIQPLRKVLLHRPGRELLNLTPDTLEQLLFDDIPYLEVAQREHDKFAQLLRDNGAEVCYLEDLVADVLSQDEEIAKKFVRQWIDEAGIRTGRWRKLIYDYVFSYAAGDMKKLVLKTMEGVVLREIRYNREESLIDYIEDNSGLVIDPMPNLYFTRDPFACIGKGVSLNFMRFPTRRRETIYGEYLFKYHSALANQVRLYYDRYRPFNIEGGDILNLSASVIAVGISQRTSPDAIEMLALNLFSDELCQVDTVLAFDIPKSRSFMHLDTVFTQIDSDKFTVHSGILGPLTVYKLTAGSSSDTVKVAKLEGGLDEILARYIGVDKVTLLPCGGHDRIAGQREQWNDGSNTLCLAPGKVVVYQRNNVTNALMREMGIEVLEIESGELSRGRGGPRCMSMPLWRESV